MQSTYLVRYWYSPGGVEASNRGGWKLAELHKTGTKFYHLQDIGCQQRRRLRKQWTTVHGILS